jgi:Zn-dependent protease with chaperone function
MLAMDDPPGGLWELFWRTHPETGDRIRRLETLNANHRIKK